MKKNNIPLKWDKLEEILEKVIFPLLRLGEWENGEFNPDYSRSFIYRLLKISKEALKKGKFSLPLSFDAFNRIKRSDWDENKLNIWGNLRNYFHNFDNLKLMVYPLQWIDLFLRKKEEKV